MMIAATMSAATSESARSSVLDLGFGAASGGGMAYFGGCSSPVNQPTAPDFIGSDAMAICSLLDAFPVDAALAFVGCGFAATAGDAGINHLDAPKAGLFPASRSAGPYALAAITGCPA
jgi:hypothetical protein